MIESSFTSIVGFHLLTVCCILLFLWIRTEGRKSIPSLETENIWHCTICTYVYIDAEDELSTCPRCGSINKKEKK